MSNKTLCAIGAGIVIGMLISPASGAKNRKYLKDACDKVSRKFNSLMGREQTLDVMVDDIKQEINKIEDQITTNTKKQINNLIDKVDNTLG